MHIIYIHIHKYIYIYSGTSLTRLTIGPTLNGPFREVVSLRSYNIVSIVLIVIDWDPNKAITIGEWSICRGSRLERFYCIYT